MLNILYDSFTQFIIIVILATLAIIVAIAIYLKQKKRKKLAYKIISDTLLLSVKEEIKKDVEIYYKNRILLFWIIQIKSLIVKKRGSLRVTSPLWLAFKSFLEQIWTGVYIQTGHVD